MLKKFFCGSCLLVIILVIGFIYFAFHGGKTFISEKIISTDFVKQSVGEENKNLLKLLPQVLGFTKPLTYLLLFQNNTEMRPSGGFIGSYAVIKMDKGEMQLIKVEGTEVLDKQAPENFKIVPPKPISDFLDVDRWYFRDSNWSPDFSESAKKALELYKGENGVSANDIQAVIAITPTVLEELLKLTGPVKIGNEEYSAENFTSKLEYEVEYGYKEKGISFLDRKDIMEPLMLTILNKIKNGIFINFKQYSTVLTKLADEKQILFYAEDDNLMQVIKDKNWAGEVKQTEGDYLLWVDANMVALKTDFALKRTLHYSLEKNLSGKWLAKAEMLYDHQGKYDWRTSRYRTYARVFVPTGSELVAVDGAVKWDNTDKTTSTVDQGEELGKKWFGTFVAIEPGKTGVLSFYYLLPDNISKKIDSGTYKLLVQKQAGTIDHGLTLDLNFGTNIGTAEPAGVVEKSRYAYDGDLRVDRFFEIGF